MNSHKGWKDIFSAFLIIMTLFMLCVYLTFITQYSKHFYTILLLFNLHPESKIATFTNTKGRPDMLTRKIHVIKNSMDKIYDKNISYYIQSYFERIKIYFDTIIKRDITKRYFIEYKFISD